MVVSNMNKTRSFVWNYFKKISGTTAKCNYCLVENSIKGGSTSNLIRHIRSKHPNIKLDQSTPQEEINVIIQETEDIAQDKSSEIDIREFAEQGPAMASEQFSLCWDNFHKNMSSGMNSLLENEDLVDVTLAVEGKCLKAHKMVLSVCSPYFKELFKSNPCQHPIVFMKDVSYVALSDLLQFMYQGEVQVSQENLTTFIKTAEALQIKGLTGDGNGSADTDVVETIPEKPIHQIEEYKPTPRPKKQPAPVMQTPSVKRPRLSVSSSDSQPLPPAVAKTEPVTSTPGGSISDTPVQFKMEPYDQNQSLIDETGDENFGDDNLDDTNVDDAEDYPMMEGGVGEEEPQAGTSTDGAGEGQGVIYFQQSKTKRSAYIILNGNSYGVNSKQSNKTVWICTSYRKTKCKARITTTKNIAKLTDLHNHEPNYLEHDLSSLPHQVFKIYEKYKYGT